MSAEIDVASITLLERCHLVGAACDLELGVPPGNAADLAAAVCAALDGLSADRTVSGRALWNLLWVAADLTTYVDLYRAQALLGATTALFARRFATTLRDRSERPDEFDAADMAFDFFFNRADQPLVAQRLERCVEALSSVLRIDNRHCQHAALHGLGHVRQHLASEAPGASSLVESILDRFCARTLDSGLKKYAEQCRRGAVS